MDTNEKAIEAQFVNECKASVLRVKEFFKEYKTLSHTEEKNNLLNKIIQTFLHLNNISGFLQYKRVAKLFYAASETFVNLRESKISFSVGFENLFDIIHERIFLCLEEIAINHSDENCDITDVILACDKICAGEILSFDEKEDSFEGSQNAEFFENKNISSIDSVSIKISRIQGLVSECNQMLSRQLKLKKEIHLLYENFTDLGSTEALKKLKQIKDDSSSMENTVLNIFHSVDSLKMLPFSIAMDSVVEKIPFIKEECKKDFDFSYHAQEIFLDKDVLSKVGCLIELLIRNALTHDSDFPPRIELSCTQNDYTIQLVVKDDSSSHLPSEKNELKLALELTEKLKGHLRIESEEDERGYSVVVEIPNSLLVRQGFFVNALSQKFFVTNHHLVDVVSKWKSELTVLSSKTFMTFEEQSIQVYKLSALLQDAKKSQNESDLQNVSELLNILIVEYMAQKIGIIVDSISAFSNVTITRLGKSFKDFKSLQGLVLDENFNFIPVLYVPEIIKRFREIRAFETKKIEAYSKNVKAKVLVVDDSATAREIEGTILQANGFEVDEARDGIEALEILKAKLFNIVICDTDMPRMNGLILLENIRRLENYADVPVIIVTSGESEEVKALYMAGGANSFMEKENFKRGNLIRLVKELLGENA